MRTFPISILATLLLVSAGCGKETEAEPASTQTSAKPASRQTAAAPAATVDHAHEHAPATVEPGSHEDWCGEHQVPESMCTRCNPSLIAAFKATGDWCQEHGLPESQCLVCNPDLKIERPPKAGEN